MAKAPDSFHEFVRELFAEMGPVQIKRMFGGAGGYADGVMFLLLDGETIHLKVDDALKAELKRAGSGPFVWMPQNGPRAGEKIDLGYWRLPEDALDDPSLAAEWGRKALAVARAKAAKKQAPAKTKTKKSAASAPKKKR